MHIPPPFRFFLVLYNWEFFCTVSSHQVSVTTTALKLPFKEAKNSFNLPIFLLKLLILRWQIEEAFSVFKKYFKTVFKIF